ncbi:hypothetical protein DFH09DRAFT_1070433 [Mycena vulgaris]|nr:hypothetical protein DFH09DRAFT_1070433 [Mycena vulgaris]
MAYYGGHLGQPIRGSDEVLIDHLPQCCVEQTGRMQIVILLVMWSAAGATLGSDILVSVSEVFGDGQQEPNKGGLARDFQNQKLDVDLSYNEGLTLRAHQMLGYRTSGTATVQISAPDGEDDSALILLGWKEKQLMDREATGSGRAIKSRAPIYNIARPQRISGTRSRVDRYSPVREYDAGPLSLRPLADEEITLNAVILTLETPYWNRRTSLMRRKRAQYNSTTSYGMLPSQFGTLLVGDFLFISKLGTSYGRFAASGRIYKSPVWNEQGIEGHYNGLRSQ